MKIGRPEMGPEVPLPVEVLEIIAAYIASDSSDVYRRQYSLWSLCLLSKQWYDVSVKQLYYNPVLGSKNFDLFVRTICPPVKSKARAVGLENLISELHMGDLAYITTKATTARLLRRAKRSLHTFVAPSHALSISSLAPISRLHVLRHLDLSRDRYDFSLSSLIKSTRSLDQLQFLSLPRGAISDYQIDDDAWTLPRNLTSLQVNSSVPALEIQRQHFFSGLPRSVSKLAFHHIQNWRQATLLFLGELHHAAPFVNELVISSIGGETLLRDEFNLADVVDVFPSLKQLEVPVTALHFPNFLLGPEIWSQSRCEELTVHEVPYEAKLERSQLESLLMELISGLQALHRIQLPSSHGRDMQGAFGHGGFHGILEERNPSLDTKFKGVFLTDANGEAERWRKDMEAHDPV